MKCYFHFDELTNRKILIPGCWESMETGKIQDCTCNGNYPPRLRKRNNAFIETIEKYQKKMDEMQEEIKRLNGRLWYLKNQSKK